MTTWFTSDTHFGHARILELGKGRPFSSVEEMDEMIIARWNARVARGDEVFHLGDFAFTEHTKYLHRLNGQKRLILGNHDHRQRMPASGWHTIDHMKSIEREGHSVVLCHYAMRVWDRSHYGALHLYGHSHGTLPGNDRSLDVGVDCWDFRPVSLSEITARMAQTGGRRDDPQRAFGHIEVAGAS